MKKLTEQIEELVELVREESDKTSVSFSIFMTSNHVDWNFEHRSPKALKASGITMQNLKGEWIKP